MISKEDNYLWQNKDIEIVDLLASGWNVIKSNNLLFFGIAFFGGLSYLLLHQFTADGLDDIMMALFSILIPYIANLLIKKELISRKIKIPMIMNLFNQSIFIALFFGAMRLFLSCVLNEINMSNNLQVRVLIQTVLTISIVILGVRCSFVPIVIAIKNMNILDAFLYCGIIMKGRWRKVFIAEVLVAFIVIVLLKLIVLALAYFFIQLNSFQSNAITYFACNIFPRFLGAALGMYSLIVLTFMFLNLDYSYTRQVKNT